MQCYFTNSYCSQKMRVVTDFYLRIQKSAFAFLGIKQQQLRNKNRMKIFCRTHSMKYVSALDKNLS